VGESPVEVLDAHSRDFSVFCNLFDQEAELKEELQEYGYCAGLLICDRVWVPDALRGRKFGPLLMASVIAELGLDRLVVCTPGAFDLPEDAKRAPVIERNEKIWGQFGFQEYAPEVWWLPQGIDRAYEMTDHYAKLVSEAEPLTMPGPILKSKHWPPREDR
jgi:hypothetical protein